MGAASPPFPPVRNRLSWRGQPNLHAAAPGVKSRSLALAFPLGLEIGNDQAPASFEHTSDFGKSLTLEASGQMMHHQGREHHIETLDRGRATARSPRSGNRSAGCAEPLSSGHERSALSPDQYRRRGPLRQRGSGLQSLAFRCRNPHLAPSLRAECGPGWRFFASAPATCHGTRRCRGTIPSGGKPPLRISPFVCFGRRLARSTVAVTCEQCIDRAPFRENRSFVMNILFV